MKRILLAFIPFVLFAFALESMITNIKCKGLNEITLEELLAAEKIDNPYVKITGGYTTGEFVCEEKSHYNDSFKYTILFPLFLEDEFISKLSGEEIEYKAFVEDKVYGGCINREDCIGIGKTEIIGIIDKDGLMYSDKTSLREAGYQIVVHDILIKKDNHPKKWYISLIWVVITFLLSAFTVLFLYRNYGPQSKTVEIHPGDEERLQELLQEMNKSKES